MTNAQTKVHSGTLTSQHLEPSTEKLENSLLSWGMCSKFCDTSANAWRWLPQKPISQTSACNHDELLANFKTISHLAKGTVRLFWVWGDENATTIKKTHRQWPQVQEHPVSSCNMTGCIERPAMNLCCKLLRFTQSKHASERRSPPCAAGGGGGGGGDSPDGWGDDSLHAHSI